MNCRQIAVGGDKIVESTASRSDFFFGALAVRGVWLNLCTPGEAEGSLPQRLSSGAHLPPAPNNEMA